MPTVSIIIPFRNGEKYLEKCILNIQKQKYDSWELILIDDGSVDNSKKIIEKYMKNPKIKYYYIKKENIGVGRARNYGIEKSNGKYIMFVDVDDYINEKLLKKLDKYIKQDIDMIKYKMKIVKKDAMYMASGPVFGITNGEEAFNKLCFKDKYLDSPSLYLIKKDFFIKTELKFLENVYHEDFGLIPQLILKANTILSVDYYGYYYIQTSNSIMRSGNYNKKINDKINHYNNIINKLEEFNLKEDTKKNVKIYYTNSVISSLGDLKKEERTEFIKKITKMNIIKNIKINNLKQLIKKIVLKININFYLSLKDKGEVCRK